jgi:uncharacterized protein YndB with AHSA1/START domain
MKRSINHQFFFSHPPEAVWEYLTNSELMGLWLMKNNFQPIIGADFQFRTGPIPSMDFDGIIYCRVLEIEPYKKLSYSWTSGPGEGRITLDSIVVWKLEPTDKGTEVFLEHSGFEEEVNLTLYNGLNKGWLDKFLNIEKLLNAKQHDTTKA